MSDGAYDVLIVGAGAAGCACAARLPEGIRALLIDRSDPRKGRCCAGLIAHDAKLALAELGLPLPEGVRVQPEPKTVHATDLESGIEQSYQRCYWNVDRPRFDSWLLDLASRRADFLPHTQFLRALSTPTGFQAVLRTSGTEQTISCRFIVAADGAFSLVRRQFFPDRPQAPRMIAIQVVLPRSPALITQEVLFSSRLTDFYAWAAPKPDSVLVGSAFSDPARAKEKFAALLDVFCHRLGLEPKVLSRGSRLLSRPGRNCELFPGLGQVLLTGEAAGLVSPSSGEGISFALRSGMAAAAALAVQEPAQTYERAFAGLARQVTAKFLKARVIFTPWTRRLALRIPYYP